MNFFTKFFGYVYDADGNYVPYFDQNGNGAFSDVRHFIWIALAVILPIIIYRLFKRYPGAGCITTIAASALLFTTRLVNQICRACIGAEVPFWRAFPFHLCTVMTFLLPLTVIFDFKAVKTPVYVLSMMGGIITVIIGDYFDSAFMTFSTIEGIAAHTLLIVIPVIEMATGRFRLEAKKSWQVVAGMVVLLVWATLANKVFFKDYDTNYMFLERNGLPGNIGGKYYFLIYVAIFFIMGALIFALPALSRHLKARKANKQKADKLSS